MQIYPKWIKYDAKHISGEDHLGLLSVGIAISDILLPGITSITIRARYYSFLCWVIEDFWKQSGKKTVANFKIFLRKREMAYIFANISQPNEYGVAGSTKGNKYWQESGQMISVNRKYLKNDYGALSLYGNPMVSCNLLVYAGNPVPKTKEPFGKEAARAFEETISKTSYYLKYLNSEEIPKSVLQEYGEVASLNMLASKNSMDREVLRKVFFNINDQDFTSVQRRETLTYLLHIIKHSHENSLTKQSLRKVMVKNKWPDKNSYSTPAEFDYISKGWVVFILRNYYSYCMTVFFSYLLGKLAWQKGVSYNKLLGLINSELTKKIDLKITLKEFCRNINDISDYEEMIDKISDDPFETNFTDDLIVSLKILGRLYVDLKKLSKENLIYDLIKLGDEDHKSLAVFIKDWEKWLENDYTLAGVFQEIFHRYTIVQHHSIATTKLITTHNETFRFVNENGVLEFRQPDYPKYNVFRISQALNMIVDLGLAKKEGSYYSITSDGEVTLDRVLRAAPLVKREVGAIDEITDINS